MIVFQLLWRLQFFLHAGCVFIPVTISGFFDAPVPDKLHIGPAFSWEWAAPFSR
jgi:hypothetical protein